MAKYRKKQIVVEAVQWMKLGDHKEVKRSPSPWPWLTIDTCGKCGKEIYAHGCVSTLEGMLIVCPGDYIITGVQGEVYPCKPDIFMETYESVVDPELGASPKARQRAEELVDSVYRAQLEKVEQACAEFAKALIDAYIDVSK